MPNAPDPGDEGIAGDRRPALHAIVLAAGEGARLARLTERLAGAPVSKQFCPFNGGRTPYQKCITRLSAWISRHRIIAVVARDDSERATDQLPATGAVELFSQFADCGTAIAVLGPLIEVLVRDPSAYVLISPADLGVVDEAALRTTLRYATGQAMAHQRTVLVGSPLARSSAGAGRLRPYEPALPGGPIVPLARLVAAPGAGAAEPATGNALVDTQLVVAPARALLELYAKLYPRLLRMFLFWASLPVAERAHYFDRAGRGLPRLDLQADLLAFSHDLAVCCLPADAGVFDLDTEHAVIAWLAADASVAGHEPSLVPLAPASDRPYRRTRVPAPSGIYPAVAVRAHA